MRGWRRPTTKRRASGGGIGGGRRGRRGGRHFALLCVTVYEAIALMAIVVSCFVLPIEKPNLCKLETHLSVGKATRVWVLLFLPSIGDGRCGAGPSKFFHAILFINLSSMSSSPEDIPSRFVLELSSTRLPLVLVNSGTSSN
jgi:hypothetical protein